MIFVYANRVVAREGTILLLRRVYYFINLIYSAFNLNNLPRLGLGVGSRFVYSACMNFIDAVNTAKNNKSQHRKKSES